MADDKRLERPENDLPRPERTPVEELRDWEPIQQNENDVTERLMVAGGYLYRTVLNAGGAVALVYVPHK